MKTIFLFLFAGALLAQGPVAGPSLGGTSGGTGGSGTVTSIATTGPIAGGPITTTGAISCPTCVTSAASLTNLGAMVGAGSQGAQTSSQLVVSNLGTPGTETWTLTNTGLGTTPAGGHALTNSTAATVGAQQASPPIVWTGQGWKTNATAASQSVAFQAYALPVQGAANPSGVWTVQSSINGAAFVAQLNVTSSGLLYTGNSAFAGTINSSSPNSGVAFGRLDQAASVYAYIGGNQVGGGTSFNGVSVASVGGFGWSGNATVAGGTVDTVLTRPAAATLQFGAIDAAAPVAQTIRFQSVVAGTSNTNGADATIKASAGTGTGIGGSIIFQVAPAGSTGTAQNTLATALTIDSTKLATFAGAIKSAAYQSSDGSAGVTGATCTAWKNGLCTSL